MFCLKMSEYMRKVSRQKIEAGSTHMILTPIIHIDPWTYADADATHN